MARDPIVWQRFEWQSGADSYKLEIVQGGMFGTLSAPGPRTVTLPMVAWEGLIESIRVARKQHHQPQSRAAMAGMPMRSGARWTDGEVEDLIGGFTSGRTVEELADHHARSPFAVQKQLEKLGLLKPEESDPADFPAGRAPQN